MSSFYGGKQGRTYHIVARFDSIADMVAAFANGGAYTQVNYGQYVLIDTILNENRKSDPQNGLIYRRGFDYQDDPSNHVKPNQNDYKDEQNNLKKEEWQSAWSSWVQQPGAGAIYVGQIVGPQGDTPEIIPVAWSEVSSDDGWQEVSGSASKGKQITINPDTGQQEIKYNDSIKIASVNLRDDQENIIGAKIAFNIPTAVIEAEVVDSNPYSEASVSQDQTSQDHPFWYKWNFVVPGGKRGSTVEDFKIESGAEAEIVVKYKITQDEEPQENKVYYKKENNKYIEVSAEQLVDKSPVNEKWREKIEQYVPYFKTTDIVRDINKKYYKYNQETQSYEEFTSFPKPSEEGEEEQQQVDFSQLYEEIQPGDSYITYNVRDYEDSADGDITEHLGRWPYRVIQGISYINKKREDLTWKQYSEQIKQQPTQDGQSVTYQSHIGDYFPVRVHSKISYYDYITVYHETTDTQVIQDKDYYKRVVEDEEESYVVVPIEQITNPLDQGLYEQTQQQGQQHTDDIYSHVQQFYFICVKEGLINPNTDSLPVFEENDNITLGNEYTVGQSRWRIMRVPETAPAHTLIIDYMAGENDSIPNLRNLDFLTVDVNGDLYATYSDSIEPYYLSNIGGIESAVLNDTGLVITYKQKDSNGNSITRSFPITQIKSINFLDDEGNEDSTLRIRYKYIPNDPTVPNPHIIDQFNIPRIQNIKFNNNDYTQTQDFQIKYKGDQEYSSISQPVNTILAIDRVGDNIIVLYSDPTVRANIPQEQQERKPWTDLNGNSYQRQSTDPEEYDAGLIWHNFGPLNAHYHVQGEYTYSDLKGDNTAQDFTLDLSNGFTGNLSDRMGWLVTVTDSNNTKHIYAYDYTGKQHSIGNEGQEFQSSWYEIMSLDASLIDPKSVIQFGDEEYTPTGRLQNGMSWYVLSYGHDNY